jgi:hypothetical protein
MEVQVQQLQYVLDFVAADLALFEPLARGERAVAGTPVGCVCAAALGPSDTGARSDTRGTGCRRARH